jgi:deoxyribose-phosphate aldolase
VTDAELDQLVAQIGEEILSRIPAASAAATGTTPGKGREGLGIPDLVCPGCTQRCAQTCAGKSKQIIAAGADRLSASDKLTKIDPAIASLIDHTLLRADATAADIKRVTAEARQFGFASVCVNPYWVPLVAMELANSPVKVCTVVGFPLGATSTDAKRGETEKAVAAGATEIDMVVNIGELKGGNHEAVKNDIKAVVEAAHAKGAIVKVILETSLLNDNEKAIACTLCKLAGADFVKTSTGFSTGGATVADIALMRSIVGPDMGVKASGGIRTLDDVKSMAAAGATRIGASASVKIMEAAAAGGGKLPGSAAPAKSGSGGY